MNIGTVIKKLRQERGMVQEQVAEYLSVSTQAVSRWETGSALPDITQVPALANLFNCSADMLFSIDIAAKEAQIQAIAEESMNYVVNMQHEKAENMLREALRDYPNSYCLMANLATVLFTIRKQNEKDKTSIQAEIIALCEKVLSECTDDEYRHRSVQLLCLSYSETGETEKARVLADKMPSKIMAREYLITDTLSGAERCKHIQKGIASDMIETLRAIICLNDNGGTYNTDENITIHHKVLDIINILVEDGNFGDYNWILADTCLHLTFFSVQKGDTAGALKYFDLAAKHAEMTDSILQTGGKATTEYTNLLFRGIESPIHRSAMPNSKSRYLLERSRELD